MVSERNTRLWSYLAAVSVIAFALNWLWEMTQMPVFVELSRKSWPETAAVCTMAALGDVVMTLAVFALGAMAAGNVQWGITGAWNVYATATVLGGLFAASFEWFSLATERWHYTDSMPIVPVIKVGLWPLLQLAALIPLSFWIAKWLTNFRPTAGRL